MKRIAFCALVATSLSMAASVLHAEPIVYSAQLSGPAEAPPNASPGTGSVTVIFDADADTLRVTASFSDLLGPTTAAHIHCCTEVPFAGAVGVATQLPSFQHFPLGVTSGTYDFTFDTDEALMWNPDFVTANGGTLAGAEAALAAGLAAGRAYFNIHTSEFRGGEIRGFLARVPEPATLALVGAALIGWWLTTRRERVPRGADR